MTAAPGLGLVGGVGWSGRGVGTPGGCGCTPGVLDGWGRGDGMLGALGGVGCVPGALGCAPILGWTAGEAVADLGCVLISTGWNCTWLAGTCTWLAGTILLVTVGGGTMAWLTGAAEGVVARVRCKVAALTAAACCTAI